MHQKLYRASACAVIAALAVTGTACAPEPGGTEESRVAAVVPAAPHDASEGEPMRIVDTTVISTVSGAYPIPVRSYAPETKPWATLVWAHGGSFIRGDLDWPEADWVARRFASEGLQVYSVDYRLANDTVKAPILAQDVADVLSWAADENDGPIVVGGASAGAQLATLAALAQAERSGSGAERPADALILQYPTLHRVQRADAALAAATAALPEQLRFDANRIAEMYSYYLGKGAEEAAAGMVAGEADPDQLAQLPPTVIVNADVDDLRASGEEFADQLRASGVPVAEVVQPGTVHGYMNRPEESERARSDAAATVSYFAAELRGYLGVM